MKTAKKISVLTVSALVMAHCALAGSDANPSKTPGNQPSSYDDMASIPPTKCNKASGFIGLEVRNQQGEHLGHIKDLVFDPKTERVSYAVMTTASKAMPINEKLLAVPLNAFTASPDQKYLILNAEKSKVEAATGFDSKNWPDVGNPARGVEQFWQKDSKNSEDSLPRQGNNK